MTHWEGASHCLFQIDLKVVSYFPCLDQGFRVAK